MLSQWRYMQGGITIVLGIREMRLTYEQARPLAHNTSLGQFSSDFTFIQSFRCLQ